MWRGLSLFACALNACSASGSGVDAPRSDAGMNADSALPVDDAVAVDSAVADVAPTDPTRAFLHADVWSTFWNDRTRCGAERTFLEICKRRGDADCSPYQKAWDACEPTKIVYGQVGPEKSSEPLCQRSAYPSVGGCDARAYDFEKLRFWWYGAEWAGNWPFATLKVFDDGKDWRSGGELVAFSSIPGAAQSAMSGISNHGLGYGCTMRGVTSGSDKYTKPFGAFAWIEVPTGKPLTVVSVASTNFGDQPFAGCNRGAATQSPWVTAAPGASLGCVHVLEKVTFAPGKHYVLSYGKVSELPTSAPPSQIVAGFALPSVGVDVTTPAACKL